MKKIILIILVLLCCFGCQAKYNLTIHDDLSVDEEIIGLEPESYFDEYPLSTKEQVIDFSMATEKKYLKKNNYSVENISEGSLDGASATTSYSSLKDYFKRSKAYGQYYDSWDLKENNGVFTLKTSAALPSNQNSLDRYYINKGTVVSITLPFKVLDSNADSYDEVSNQYVWNLDYKKSIYLKFDTNNPQTYIKNNSWIVVSGIILFVVIAIIVLVVKKKNNNKI